MAFDIESAVPVDEAVKVRPGRAMMEKSSAPKNPAKIKDDPAVTAKQYFLSGALGGSEPEGSVTEPNTAGNKEAYNLGEGIGIAAQALPFAPAAAKAGGKLLAEGVYQGMHGAGPLKHVLAGAGPKYIIGGERALTADRSALIEARKMEKAGADSSDIWKATGWAKGKEGRWKHEITDSTADLDISHLNEAAAKEDAGEGPVHVPLGKVLKHEHLYNAYPQLKETRIQVGDPDLMGDSWGEYSPEHNLVTVHPEFLTTDKNDAKKRLLHEVQHAVQGEEGFGLGAHGDDPNYGRVSGEVEARNVEKRSEYGPEESRTNPLTETEDVPRDEQVVRRTRGKMSVVKDKGGNWMEGSIEKALRPLKAAMSNGEKYTAEHVKEMNDKGLQNHLAYNNVVKGAAINDWIDKKLVRYIRNEMGTKEDPIRALMERGISHVDVDKLHNRGAPIWASEESVSPEARKWERASDSQIPGLSAGTRIKLRDASASWQDGVGSWIDKLHPDTPVYHINPYVADELGFDHLIDVIKDDLASGRMSVSDLNKLSVPDAVRRAHNYNIELEKAMAKDKKALFDKSEVVHTEPSGVRVIKLNRPGQFAAESDAMGHSVRGYEPSKNHPDWVRASGNSGSDWYGHGGWNAIKNGRAEVYSVKGPNGEALATIEVKRRLAPANNELLKTIEKAAKQLRGDVEVRQGDNLSSSVKYYIKFPKGDAGLGRDFISKEPFGWDKKNRYRPIEGSELEGWVSAIEKATGWKASHRYYYPSVSKVSRGEIGITFQKPELGKDGGYSVTQIKGPKNRSVPQEAVSAIREFLASRKWDEIKDLPNVGITRASISKAARDRARKVANVTTQKPKEPQGTGNETSNH